VITPERAHIDRTARGTVTLNRAAESAGVVVALSSSDSDVAKVEPASLTIPAGSTTATFEVRAFGQRNGRPISENTLVIIEAKINGVGRAAAFVVEP
jgi:hypothetical protein